jgi:endonuclease/exonuclease/phosphatase family metal-dependent hydrolase
MNVDILLMCELSKNDNPLILDSISKNYPYNIIEFSDSFKRNECQVFSKYPIKNLRTVNYNDTISNGAIWLMEVETDSGKINLAAVHLASNRYGSIRDTMNASSTWLSGYKSYIRYTKEGYAIRAAQAIALRDSLDCLEGPIIVMGDFNDIGGSYAVKKIMGNDLGDAWWNGGFGYGFTYDMYHLLLRLDHILYSERIFDLEGVKVLDDWKYSDHYPLVADFSYK